MFRNINPIRPAGFPNRGGGMGGTPPSRANKANSPPHEPLSPHMSKIDHPPHYQS